MDIKLIRKWVNTDGVVIPDGLGRAMTHHATIWANKDLEFIAAQKVSTEAKIVGLQKEIESLRGELSKIQFNEAELTSLNETKTLGA
jgi:hypothetical protein